MRHRSIEFDYIHGSPNLSTSRICLLILDSVIATTKSIMSTSVSIDALPTELIDRIFRLAKLGRKDPEKVYMFSTGIIDFRGDPNEVNPNEEHPLYKSLRLVCKRWRDISTPLLFDTFVLLSHVKVSFYPPSQ